MKLLKVIAYCVNVFEANILSEIDSNWIEVNS